jgi:histo-blood group ABO system transferase
MRVALIAIATAKYTSFIPQWIESAQRHFFPGCDREFIVFSDQNIDGPFTRLYVQHHPWPGVTLRRYHTMLSESSHLAGFDYLFHVDIDMRFVGDVADEICGEGLTATIHPGFAYKRVGAYTYERRAESMACTHNGTRYYAGAFQGGRTVDSLRAWEEMAEDIDTDAARGITAVWHDESHWNRYLADHPPAIALSLKYCCPENWPVEDRRILILGKKCADIRRE